MPLPDTPAKPPNMPGRSSDPELELEADAEADAELDAELELRRRRGAQAPQAPQAG